MIKEKKLYVYLIFIFYLHCLFDSLGSLIPVCSVLPNSKGCLFKRTYFNSGLTSDIKTQILELLTILFKNSDIANRRLIN